MDACSLIGDMHARLVLQSCLNPQASSSLSLDVSSLFCRDKRMFAKASRREFSIEGSDCSRVIFFLSLIPLFLMLVLSSALLPE